MKIIILILTYFCLEMCLGHYLPANHNSVIISKLFARASVPRRPILVKEIKQIYGLPHVKFPTIVYGVPTRTFDFDINDVIGEETHTEESSQKPQIPATSYGIPVYRVEPPKFEQYNLPDPHVPATTYGVPVYDVRTVQKPFTVYGLPKYNVK